MFTRAGLAALLACIVVAGGCTAEADSPEPVATSSEPGVESPSPSPAVTIPPVDPTVVRAGLATLQRYLDVWADRGLVVAGRYLVPDERITRPNGQDLLSGGVTHHEVAVWDGPDHFTLLVWMSLTAENLKDPFQARLLSSFNQHPHTVAFTRTPDGRYLLSFASSP